jgi:DNA repair exonuclease SbcCD ATPase subunit
MSQLDEVIAASYTVSVKINDLENQIKAITNLSSIDSKMDESEEIQRQLIECKSQLYHIGMMKAQKEQAIANRNCPTCGQEVQKDSCEDIVIPDDTELKDKHDYLKEEHTRVMLECAHLINKKNENSLLKEKVQHLQEQKNQITREIERVERLDNPYLDKLEELSINKKKLYNKLEVINQSILLQNTLQTRYEYLKDGFKQIKSYVFQSLLSELNRSTNRYLNELFEVPASIIFDNISDDGEISKIKTTVMLDGNERSLGLLSGGQFRRVQLAVDFALSDIVAQRSKNPINVKILDEAFKDLSEPSMERIVGVLQKMSGCTILIEHNSIIKNIVNRIYKVELKDGISTHIP